MFNQIKQFIKNVYTYRELLFHSRSYDFDYAHFKFCQIKLQEYISDFEKGYFIGSVNEARYIKKARIALEYLDRILEDKVPYHTNYISTFNNNRTVFDSMFINTKRGINVPNIQSSKTAARMVLGIENEYKKQFYNILTKYSGHWWD